MYLSKYFTCEQIDQRLLQGYYDDAVAAGYLGTIQEFLEELLTAINFAKDPQASAIKYNGTNVEAELNSTAQKIALLYAKVDVTITASPSTLYKNEAGQVTFAGTMVNGTPTAMKIVDGDVVLATGDSSPLVTTQTITLSTNSHTYGVVGTVMGLDIPSSVVVNARYPIYYGFAASASALAVNANRYSPTTTAAHTYEKTASTSGQHFYILVPSDISALTKFTMGGAPFVMESSTETINGIVYKVYRSGNTYNSGTKLTVVAS